MLQSHIEVCYLQLPCVYFAEALHFLEDGFLLHLIKRSDFHLAYTIVFAQLHSLYRILDLYIEKLYRGRVVNYLCSLEFRELLSVDRTHH